MPFWITWDLDLHVAGIDSVQRLGNFELNAVTPDYFATLGTRILRGRGIEAQDGEHAPRVMVASQAMAKTLWPGRDPIGQCVRIGADTAPCSYVVGVAERVVALETRRPVTVCPGPDITILADGGQLDQLLINLVRNAVDATLESNGHVELEWTGRNGRVDVWVRDDGPGLADTANLFVPFYTTKADGSGIGLALSRQIAEAHSGTLILSNRGERRGCEAQLSLALAGASETAP